MHDAILRIRQGVASAQFAIAVGAVVCTGIAIYTAWYVSTGLFPNFPPSENSYIDLGESFLQGQLALLEKPDPQLTVLPDPYDPAQRTAPYRWDASYYEGKYYLYWGPVPALFFAAVEGLTRSRPPGALLIVLCYISLSILLFMILFRLWRKYFPLAPGFSLGLCVLVGLVNLPMLFILGRPIVYETSSIAGQFFLILGLLGWIHYTTSSEKPGWLVLTGVSWGLAIGSRYSLLLSIIVYLAFALTRITREINNPYGWRKVSFLLVPLGLCLAGLGIYNFARFGDPLETGLSYQLSLPEAHSEPYSLSYFLSNLYVYLFYPMTTSESFPFILSTLSPESRFDEVSMGLFPSVPGAWLFLLIIPLVIARKKRVDTDQADSTRSPLKSLNSMLLITGMTQFLLLTVYFFAAMRYIADFYLQFTLAVWILVWQADKFLQRRKLLRVSFWVAVTGFVFWTILIGFFGSFDIPGQAMRISNPTLYSSLESFWNSRHLEIKSLLKLRP